MSEVIDPAKPNPTPRDLEKLKLLDELMEKTKFLCYWADEGFVGTKEQQDILRGHLGKAEKLLFEANCFLARLYETIPVNLASRVCGQPVWLPSTLKWLKEKFKVEDEKRRAENPPKPKVKTAKPSTDPIAEPPT